MVEQMKIPTLIGDTEGSVINVQGTGTAVLAKSLKLMDGKYGGAFYVRYLCDTGRGCGWLQMLIEYPTGLVQTRLLCKNVCMTSSYEQDGVGVVKENSAQKRPHIVDSMKTGGFDILMELERPDMPIPMSTLWQRIIENYSEIPVFEVAVKTSMQDVYEALLEFGENLVKTDAGRQGNGYILLTKDEVQNTIASLGYALNEIRTEFALRGLWVTDKNSGSYQKTKKVDGKNVRFYALKTELADGNNLPCKAVKNVAYEESVPSTRESEQMSAESQVPEMKEHEDNETPIVW